MKIPITKNLSNLGSDQIGCIEVTDDFADRMAIHFASGGAFELHAMLSRECGEYKILVVSIAPKGSAAKSQRSNLLTEIDQAIQQVKDVMNGLVAQGRWNRVDAAEELLLEFVKIKVCAAESLIKQLDLSGNCESAGETWT